MCLNSLKHFSSSRILGVPKYFFHVKTNQILNSQKIFARNLFRKSPKVSTLKIRLALEAESIERKLEMTNPPPLDNMIALFV